MAEALIDSILKEYEKLRYEAIRKRDEYVKKIKSQYPEIKEIEEKINNCGVKYTGEIVKTPEKGDALILKMEEEIKSLKEERKKILSSVGISEDYNEVKYNCEKCKDRGFIENEKCSCLKERLKEIGYEKSNLGILIKTQNFEKFNFSFYEDEKNSRGYSPSDYINVAYKEAKKFCENFKNSENLLFYGNTGLGKTFLSSCIAKEIIDLGYSVRFISSSKLFSIYDDYKFNRGNEEENRLIIDEMYGCDLIIIDDLGTEFFTQNSFSFLYDLFNERIIKGKKIIITTNLSFDELTSKYTPRFISRLYESFKTIKFEGKNIRKKIMKENN